MYPVAPRCCGFGWDNREILRTDVVSHVAACRAKCVPNVPDSPRADPFRREWPSRPHGSVAKIADEACRTPRISLWIEIESGDVTDPSSRPNVVSTS